MREAASLVSPQYRKFKFKINKTIFRKYDYFRAHVHLAFAFAMHLASIVFNGTRHT